MEKQLEQEITHYVEQEITHYVEQERELISMTEETNGYRAFYRYEGLEHSIWLEARDEIAAFKRFYFELGDPASEDEWKRKPEDDMPLLEVFEEVEHVGVFRRLYEPYG